MNYPRIFERVYSKPLAITEDRFHSIHAVLLPRMADGGSNAFDLLAAEGDRPTVNPYSGKRAQRCRPGYRPDGSVDTNLFTFAKEGVAVVPVYGVLAKNVSAYEESCGGGTDINPIGLALTQALAAPDVRSIVLDFDSPGGEVVGITELASAIRAAAAQKPVYGFTDSGSYSASYWLMSQCSEIYSTRSAGLGSIGIRAGWLDQTIAMQLRGLKLHTFSAGKHKAAGAPFRGMTKEEMAMLQGQVDHFYGQFTADIQSARPQVSIDTMQGQTFTAADSLKRGLIDGIVGDWAEFIGLL